MMAYDKMRFALLGLYSLLSVVCVVQLVRYSAFLRNGGSRLKLFYFFILLTSLTRAAQFYFFKFASFEEESKAAFCLVFAGCVLYFTAFASLVFCWAATCIRTRTTVGEEQQPQLHTLFYSLLGTVYTLSLVFIVVVVEVKVSPDKRFLVAVIGTGLMSLMCASSFAFFTVRLRKWFHRADLFLARGQRRAIRKIYVISVVCVSTFSMRVIYLGLCLIMPNELQGQSNVSMEFYYYFAVEILPTFVLLFFIGVVSNDNLKKMSKRRTFYDQSVTRTPIRWKDRSPPNTPTVSATEETPMIDDEIDIGPPEI